MLSSLSLRSDVRTLGDWRPAVAALRVASGMSGDGDRQLVPTTCAGDADTLDGARGTSGDTDLIAKRAVDFMLVPTCCCRGVNALGVLRGMSGDNDLAPEGAGVGGRSRDRDRALLPLPLPLPLPLSSRSPASRTTYGSRGTTLPDLIQLLIHALLSTARADSPRTEWRTARCPGSVAR